MFDEKLLSGVFMSSLCAALRVMDHGRLVRRGARATTRPWAHGWLAARSSTKSLGCRWGKAPTGASCAKRVHGAAQDVLTGLVNRTLSIGSVQHEFSATAIVLSNAHPTSRVARPRRRPLRCRRRPLEDEGTAATHTVCAERYPESQPPREALLSPFLAPDLVFQATAGAAQPAGARICISTAPKRACAMAAGGRPGPGRRAPIDARSDPPDMAGLLRRIRQLARRGSS